MRAGRYPEALELAARIIEFDPGFPRGHSIWGWAQIKMGHDAQGLAALARAVGLDPDGTFFQAQLGQAYAMTGKVEEARDVLRKLHALARLRFVSPYLFAYVYTGLGEDEQAMDWLERAYEQRAGPVCGIKGSFLFRSLRTHPRFTALLKKMNLA